MIEEHIDGKRDHNFRIWIFMNLEIWYRIFIEHQTLESIEEWINGYVKSKGQNERRYHA
jgi:hypothetical protein